MSDAFRKWRLRHGRVDDVEPTVLELLEEIEELYDQRQCREAANAAALELFEHIIAAPRENGYEETFDTLRSWLVLMRNLK